MRAALRKNSSLSFAAFVALSSLALPAHAHALFGSAAPFWSGVLHFLVTPMALAAAIGCIVALAGIGERNAFWAMACAAVGAFFGAEMTNVPPLLAPGGVAVIGLIAAGGWNPSLVLACLLAAVAGVCAGGAVAADAQDWGGSFGAAMAMVVLASWGVGGLIYLQGKKGFDVAGGWGRITALGRRIVGAWIAAIALLVAALGFVMPA